eukprot:CAMPEP_0201571814 /NCGR_PEP_ID=MMETSP0190_2-20130828/14749_1 /ASSEMBLY_ACC=CAM_ASM_000263 /TAXON_ID=37353 /ORGANISM="Rosalina sp." /LENGTH=199 /DNA_ID=CAMNT_0047996861 /DNA_START=50 /DNA_END=649 /DNA_ORIENTATION=+
MFITISLLLALYTEISSGALSQGRSTCLTGRGPYYAAFGGVYNDGSCETPPSIGSPPMILVEEVDEETGFTISHFIPDPDFVVPRYEKCAYKRNLYDENLNILATTYLRTVEEGDQYQNKEYMVSYEPLSRGEPAADTNFEIYCNTDADKVTEKGFRNPIALMSDSDPLQVFCGGKLGSRNLVLRSSLASLSIGSCSTD